MKLIRQYILSEFLKPLLGCLFLFIALFLIIDLFDNLDDISKAQVPMFVMYDYYASLIPYIFVQISPIIVMLAAMITLNNLQRHHEIIALKAIGINLWNVFSLFFICGILMSGANFAVNELIKPEAYMHAQTLKERYFTPRKQYHKTTLMNQVTFFGSHNRLYLIQTYDPLRYHMENITISESDTHNELRRRITAKQAQWVQGYWIFYDCVETEYENGALKGTPTLFKEKTFSLDETPQDIKRAQMQPDMMSYWRLRKFIRRLQHSNLNTDKEMVTLHNKIAFPLANFILLFFAVPFTLSQVRGANPILGATISLAVGFSYWGINAIFLSLGKLGALDPLTAAWITNLIFLITGFLLLSGVKK